MPRDFSSTKGLAEATSHCPYQFKARTLSATARFACDALSEQQQSWIQETNPDQDDEAISEPSLYDSEKWKGIADISCWDCYSVNLEAWLEGTNPVVCEPPGYRQATLSMDTKCHMCAFLGFNSSLSVNSANDSSKRLNVSMLNWLPGSSYTFQQGPFLSSMCVQESDNKRSSEYREKRIFVPVIRERISAQPKPPYRPLRPDCVDFDMFRPWLEDCVQHHHATCSPGDPFFQIFGVGGFRLIDCITSEVVLASIGERYVALSYVWGEELASADSRHVDVEKRRTQQFPHTIQDAMTVAVKLGFHYLWVDRYCINQDNTPEKQEQISKMDSIYQCAALTIIAAAGTSSHRGLPGVRTGSRRAQPRIDIDGTTWVSLLANPGDAVHPDPKTAPKQGHIMVSSAQTDTKGVPVHPNAGYDLFMSLQSVISRPDREWVVLKSIGEYTQRELSYQSDALNAIRGLFSRVTNATNKYFRGLKVGPFHQFWGIPTSPAAYCPENKDDLDTFEELVAMLDQNQQIYAAMGCGMNWRSSSNEPSVRRQGFPSWSWAGWITPVTWPISQPGSYDCAIRDIPKQIWIHTNWGEAKPLTESVLEHITRLHGNEASLYTYRLGIETNIVQITLSCCTDPRIGFAVIASDDTLGKAGITGVELDLLVWRVDITPNAPEGSALRAALCSETFECAVMFGHYGIMLRTQDGVSERVGIVELDAFGCSNEAQFRTGAPNDAGSRVVLTLLRFIRTSTISTKKSWFNFRGQHDERDKEGVLQPMPGQIQQAFWFDDTLFMLDESKADSKPSEPNKNDWGCVPNNSNYPARQLTVRCFGHTNGPIVELLNYIKAKALESVKLEVIKVMPGSTAHDLREKRPLSSIETEPKMRDQIQQKVEDIFHKDSRKVYSDTSRPCRHGFLFYGPPGTGKTSLAVAVAAHACVPLVTITLRGMDDKGLEKALANIPLPSVVLMEDIDVSSADVGKRDQPAAKKNLQPAEEVVPINTAEAVNIIEQTIGQFMSRYHQEQLAEMKRYHREQALSNKAVLELISAHVGYEVDQNDAFRGAGEASNSSRQKMIGPSQSVPVPIKSITMSGLLNVIDGAASVEGGLLIMTTNHKNHLDDALIRPGRCDSEFEITYATKNSAEQTFKRMFGLDPNRKYRSEAINRFAEAFKKQFPEESTIATAALAGYCARHRNRPVEAVENFPEWLRISDEIFDQD
ncbi:hypothetical protein CC86DRAFT_458869 [Ophiobolus disseminans]|uniref:AAA+ ATPase domain-containing protein n=1 Tax=Ophiobolus disseminans TaxID=1469910 RepID=A0A6A6ZND5_9PLEO|nr:hypothetical protein CC86DRAFT_458869 [Ophiobolus disseminans]